MLDTSHFIPNNFIDAIPDPHEYHFTLVKSKEVIEIELDIRGVDGMKYIDKMAKISEAESSQQGKPRMKD